MKAIIDLTTDSGKKIKHFIQTIERILYEKNITVPEFAEMMNVSRMSVYNWFRLESMMSLDKYFKALDLLGLKHSSFNAKKKI